MPSEPPNSQTPCAPSAKITRVMVDVETQRNALMRDLDALRIVIGQSSTPAQRMAAALAAAIAAHYLNQRVLQLATMVAGEI